MKVSEKRNHLAVQRLTGVETLDLRCDMRQSITGAAVLGRMLSTKECR